MKSFIVALTFFSMGLHGADSFDGIECSENLEKELKGRKIPNERVQVLEAKFKDLGLKDLGADMPEQGVTFIQWKLCGGDFFHFLEKEGRVKDVLRVVCS
jgi:hypothetical protein